MSHVMTDAALEPLEALAGEWQMEIVMPQDPTTTIHGQASFAWLPGGGFLVERWEIVRPEFPDGIQIIGRDATAQDFTAHYFDSRGVARIYAMSLNDDVWRLWRDDPNFAQRFIGTFSDQNETITGRWEKSPDGSTWEHDFNLTYRRVH